MTTFSTAMSSVASSTSGVDIGNFFNCFCIGSDDLVEKNYCKTWRVESSADATCRAVDLVPC